MEEDEEEEEELWLSLLLFDAGLASSSGAGFEELLVVRLGGDTAPFVARCFFGLSPSFADASVDAPPLSFFLGLFFLGCDSRLRFGVFDGDADALLSSLIKEVRVLCMIARAFKYFSIN